MALDANLEDVYPQLVKVYLVEGRRTTRQVGILRLVQQLVFDEDQRRARGHHRPASVDEPNRSMGIPSRSPQWPINIVAEKAGGELVKEGVIAFYESGTESGNDYVGTPTVHPGLLPSANTQFIGHDAGTFGANAIKRSSSQASGENVVEAATCR